VRERELTGLDGFLLAFQFGFADVVRVLVVGNLIPEVDLKRRGLVVHVLTQREDSGGDPSRVGHRDRGPAVGFDLFQNRVPHRFGVLRGLADEDLESLLAGVPRLAHQHRDVVDRRLQQPVVGDLAGHVADEFLHHVEGLGALNLHRRDVDLVDLDLEVGPDGDAL